MYELEDILMELVKKYTLYRASTFHVMKHKHKGQWRTSRGGGGGGHPPA